MVTITCDRCKAELRPEYINANLLLTWNERRNMFELNLCDDCSNTIQQYIKWEIGRSTEHSAFAKTAPFRTTPQIPVDSLIRSKL